MLPGVQLTVTDPHALDAVTLLSHDGKIVGLQPSDPPLGTFARTGADTTCQVYVTDNVVVNPHAVAL